MPSLCRDCLTRRDDAPAPAAGRPRCTACGSPRILTHPELFSLDIAHIDCDAFYAAVEKCDHPEWRDLPVIVGGGHRGVVSTACYIARIQGVHSAMPMYRAVRLCPDAVIVRPRMAVYAEVSQRIRTMMAALTPAVEPLSLDEAFLDLSGTARLHGAPPAVLLAGLAQRIETELGVTASVGLSHNKFLAKIASDLDKPRGFSTIGRAETGAFLAALPVRAIWGVGAVTQAQLEAAGIRRIADLLRWDRDDLRARFGGMGDRLFHLARGEDTRPVRADAPVKSISNEVTLATDTADGALIEAHLWRLAQSVSDRAKARGHAGRTVTLKLRRPDFTLLTRRQGLPEPTQSTERIFAALRNLAQRLRAQGETGPFRLIGVGLGDLAPAARADLTGGDLIDPAAARRLGAERASDSIRARFGPDAIIKGRALRH